MDEQSKMQEVLKRTFLFSGLEVEQIDKLLKECPPEIKRYNRTEIIYSSNTGKKTVGIILDGKCEVRREKADGSLVVLNILEQCDSFGILSVLSNEEFPTTIFALKNSNIVFFSSDQIEYFVNNYSQISQNLIKFLANRIVFLNKKIATFSGTRVEDRLAAYIIAQKQMLGKDVFAFNCQKTAKEINAGRASIYRALESMENEKLIEFDNKKIIITDLMGLERITK